MTQTHPDFNQNLNALDIRFDAKEIEFNQKFKYDVCNCNVWKVQKPGILIKLAITPPNFSKLVDKWLRKRV